MRLFFLLLVLPLLGCTEAKPTQFRPHVIEFAYGSIEGEEYVILDFGDEVIEFRGYTVRKKAK